MRRSQWVSTILFRSQWVSRILFRSQWVSTILLLLMVSDLSGSTRAGDGAELAAQVLICRDTYGIPHIQAKTEEAASFGLGYAQAEDHCLQIVRLCLSARGEEARNFGTGEENDFMMKLYDNLEESGRDLNRLPSWFRRIVNAYVAGVNRYIEQHRTALPAWVRPISGAEIMANRRSEAIHSAFSRATIRALAKKYPAPRPQNARLEGNAQAWSVLDLTSELTDADLESGSNALALGAAKTVSGKPILLGNPHLNWNSLYWEAQVTVPGKIDFFGSTLAGIPVLRAGFNEHLGWVTTNNSPDLTDVFALKMDQQHADHYLFEGKSRPLIRREIAVEVISADGKSRLVRRAFWDSHLGKILYRTPEKAFAVRTTFLDAFRHHEAFYRLSKTKNLNQFFSVMRKGFIPTSNFTYADADGNVLYLWNARVPNRVRDGTDYSLDVPGETGKYVWKKLHKLDDLPRLLNPKGGYVQNCNNPPWYASLRDPIDPAKFPPYLEEEREVGLRPQMALALIEGKDRFSLDDVTKLKFETRMLLAERVRPDLLQALRAANAASSELKEGIAAVENWDGRVSAGSRGAVLFQKFWDLYSAELPQPFRIPWSKTDPAGTPMGISDPGKAVKAFQDAVEDTKKLYGSADVAWGDVNRFRFGDLDLPGDGASGTYGLFRVLRFAPGEKGRHVAGQIVKDAPPVGFGDAWVLAVEFARPVRARSILAYGESTLSSSPHSRDQIEPFARHDLRPVWFTQSEISAHLEREYHP